ncbi:hypothetical protein [Pseudoduganella sp. HUAS MS19]
MRHFNIDRLTRLMLIASVMLFAQNANALGQFSRSCRFSEIPFGLQNVSARFFYAVGGPEYVKTLPQKSEAEQAKYRILESLTTDYTRFRYLLFAMSWVLDRGGANGDWRQIAEYRSIWTAESINAAMEVDPYFRPYYLNRQWLFSARAGSPLIAEWWPGDGQALVLGAHFYYDLAGKRTVRLPDSMAVDCNLSDFGLGLGLWGR